MKMQKLLFVALFLGNALAAQNNEITLDAPPFVLKNVPFDIRVSGIPDDSVNVWINGISSTVFSVETEGDQRYIDNVSISSLGNLEVRIAGQNDSGVVEVFALPGVVSILPPVMAIALALITKQVLLSLFCGIWLGAILTLGGYNPFFGFLRTIDTYLIRAITDTDHMRIVLFTMTLGGMVGIVSRSGGTHGIVQSLARYAKGRRRGQVATWLMGILIFFDDYSNTLLVGNTMRPFTDKLRISREKLSYLVDSTAAPITSIALASTWIGFELGLLNSSFSDMGIQENAYITFLAAIPYSFYSIMALVMVLVIALSGRDFGPMLHAETRSLREGKILRDNAKPLLDQELANLMPPEGVKSRWHNAIIPILTMIIVLAIGLYIDGKLALGEGDHTLRDIIGAADSFDVLIWASFGGAMVAGLLAVGARVLSIGDTVDAFLVGFRAMIVGIIILTLARSLQLVTGDLHTADYIFHITEEILNPRLLPSITFIIAALISFSTGTSFGTMAILVPLVIPLAYLVPSNAGLSAASQQAIFLGSIGAILSGAIFGDHCSPISDTTVMSSMASGADHIDHVRTQLPYGVLVAGVTLLFGYIPAGFGANPFVSNLLALGMLLLIIWRFGRDPAAVIEKAAD